MQRTQISLPQPLIDKLDKTAKKKGISRSELIRYILNYYYDKR
ncbi:CopG family ribbon-helix-helix protein [Acetohalobium arabaticum]